MVTNVSIGTMAKNIVSIMDQLSANEGIMCLLVNNGDNPFKDQVSAEAKANAKRPNNPDAKILPYPFDVEAKTTTGSFIRVYYNQGTFNSNESISEADIFIDVIVSKDLWLINKGVPNSGTIRPYEIMDRVIDMVGRRATKSPIRLKVEGYSHLYINTKFDAIRIYCSHWSVETTPSDKR